MSFITTIDAECRCQIPRDLLLQLGLQPGDSVRVILGEGALQLEPATPSGSVVKGPVPPHDAIQQRNLQVRMQFIRGVGPKLSDLLAKRGIETVEDALYTLPLRYEDRRDVRPVRELRSGYTEVFSGRVVSAESRITKGGKRYFEAMVADQSGSVILKWFNGNPLFMKRTWKPGREGIFTGEVSQYGPQREVHHPEVEWIPEGRSMKDVLAGDPVNFGRIVPVYPLTEGLNQKVMRKLMRQVVDNHLRDVSDTIPRRLLDSLNLNGLQSALGNLHTPRPEADLAALNRGDTPDHRAIAFDEFFYWELGLALKKRGVALENGISFSVNHRYTRELARLLPFELTAAQRRVLSEIKNDMIAPHPMHRLVQGDVGSGKTLVALMAALIAVENGYQVAVMAPTEILAEQHWHTMHGWCSKLGIATTLITSAMKGKEKGAVLAAIADGTAMIVIGTHAVIQEKVEFARLGLGIVDEQHRFGVLQRGLLRRKGCNPDILVMTATPIPRTLAMTLYGDLSLSVIDELPPGRSPIRTELFFENRRQQVYECIAEEIRKGHQAYVIYPLVEESEKTELKAATQMAEQLGREVFPDLRIGLLHGRLSPEEKEEVMGAFKSRSLDILVATTVIEVGIDVPNATVMVVEHAERFGLSQLHQLRGRVGRGSSRSRCILLTPGRLSEEGEKRLRVMTATTDGFRIAEADLEIRGPGDFLGTRQSGLPDFRVASILRDGAILEQARAAAFDLLESDPDLSSNVRIREELLRRWGHRLELGSIG